MIKESKGKWKQQHYYVRSKAYKQIKGLAKKGINNKK